MIMRISLSVLLVAILGLSACSSWRESRANPGNWFGNNNQVQVEEAVADTGGPLVDTEPDNALIPADRRGLFDRPDEVDVSVPIGTVTELRVDPTNNGAIIYASGVADRQGAFDARLVIDEANLEADDGVLNLSFRVVYPEDPTPVGSEFSRTVHDAYTISAQAFSQVRVIRVSGARNTMETRRR